jgi:hypothetical protein
MAGRHEDNLPRRAVLAAGLGAAAAAAAGALAAPARVAGADGDYVRVGQVHTGTTVTKLSVTAGDALEVETSDLLASAVVARNPSSHMIGVLASSTAGVEAIAQNPLDLGLYVSGKAKFTRSGSYLIGTNRSYATITGLTIGPNSFALATLQANRAGFYVQAVVPSEARSRITIYLNKKVPAPTKVAWIVFD